MLKKLCEKSLSRNHKTPGFYQSFGPEVFALHLSGPEGHASPEILNMKDFLGDFLDALI